MLISQPLKTFKDGEKYLVECNYISDVPIIFCTYEEFEDAEENGFYIWDCYTRIPNDRVIEVRQVLPGDHNDSE